MKCLILGSGATAWCDVANEERRPPMLNETDLRRMIERPVFGVMNSPFGEQYLQPMFARCLSLYDWKIEEFCTDLFSLSRLPKCENGLEADTRAFFGSHSAEHRLARAICSLGGRPDTTQVRNLITMFEGAVRDEVHQCIGTQGDPPQPIRDVMPVSDDHRALARALNANDAVISFNYDELMPYALMNERRIAKGSFTNKFLQLLMRDEYLSDQPVYLVTPHGSWTWRMAERGGKFYLAEVLVDLAGGQGPYPEGYGFLPNMILPLRNKAVAAKSFPAQWLETQLALNFVQAADEIHLVGKQFFGTDEDWVEALTEASKQKVKRLVIANPSIESQKWSDYHCTVFNAPPDTTIKLANFRDYVAWMTPR